LNYELNSSQVTVIYMAPTSLLALQVIATHSPVPSVSAFHLKTWNDAETSKFMRSFL